MNLKEKTKFLVRTDLIKDYLRDITRTKLITKEQEEELFKEYYSTDDEDLKIEIRNKIIMAHQRFVFAIAKRYDNGDLLPDLINQGNLGMFEAFQDYDPKLGYRFTTLAGYYVRRSINAYLSKENLMIRPTNNNIYTPKVKKIEQEYYAKYGRKPTYQEVVDTLMSKYKIEIKSPSDIYGANVEYIDDYTNEDDAEQLADYSLYAITTASCNNYEIDMEHEDLSYRLHKAIDTLTDREATIIKMSTGIGDYYKEYKDKEIAEVMNMSSERVRQLRHQARHKLATAYATAY